MLHTESVAGTTLELLKKLEAEKRMSICSGGLFKGFASYQNTWCVYAHFLRLQLTS